MTSADFCEFSAALGGGCPFQGVSRRPPRVPHVSFPPSTCLIYSMRFRAVTGLRLGLQSYPRMQPNMSFLYVRPEVCPRVSTFPASSFLQIPSRDGHPCLRLYPSHYRVDSGLAPVRNVRRRAHQKSSVTGHRNVRDGTFVRYSNRLFQNFRQRSYCLSAVRCQTSLLYCRMVRSEEK